MKKILVATVLCLVFIFLFSLYDPVDQFEQWMQIGGGEQEVQEPVSRATVIPINPVAQDAQKDGVYTTLYYRYGNTIYLGQEANILLVPRDKIVEQSIVAALIEGPDGAHAELQSVFNAGVQVLATENEDGVMHVTLSDAFLDLPTGAPEYWESDSYWSREVPLRRQLALESIVLSLTEGARCESILMLTASSSDVKVGERIPRAFFYPDEADKTTPLEPVTRSESSVLTPRSAMQGLLLSWQSKSWESLYGFLSTDTSQTQISRPTLTEFITLATENGKSLLSFNVSNGTFSAHGEKATIVIATQTSDTHGERTKLTGVPLEVVRERDNWKISYTGILSLMQRK